MRDDARSAQGKRRGQSRMTLHCVDRASSSMISQDRTAFFSPRISGMVLFFLSRVVGTNMTHGTRPNRWLSEMTERRQAGLGYDNGKKFSG